MSTKMEEKKSQLRIEGSPSVPCQIHAQKAFLELTSYRRVSLISRISTDSRRNKNHATHFAERSTKLLLRAS